MSCEAGGSSIEELKKCPLPSPAVLWFVNDCERKTRWKTNILIYYIGYVTIKNSKYIKINTGNTLLSTKWMDILKKLIKVSI